MQPITVALAGNPNVGKSSVFNALTGLRQHTGNWPGKTVVTAEGRCTYEGREIRFVDLPGTYSLTAHSPRRKSPAASSCSAARTSPSSSATRPAWSGI